MALLSTKIAIIFLNIHNAMQQKTKIDRVN